MFFLVIMHSGKTNMLEAIFVCAIGKSFRTKNEKELIHLNQNELTIEIEYQKSDRDGKIKYEISDKKNIFLNGIKIKKLSELLGNIHIVLFTPDDINILKGGPAERRKFLDIMIGQLRPNYVYNLNLFLKTLEQRNSYLRQIKLENKNQDLLDIWDEKLADYAQIISQYRKEFIDKISKKIDHIHQEITEGKEKLLIEYVSQCSNKEDYLKLLKQNRNLDIIKGYTTKGIHRDDFRTYINNKEVNIYGSQGQHRTVILSLKLAELNVVYDEMGEYPILLLDDFMSEFDEKRRKSFLNHIKDTQVIITCTDKIKVDNLNFNLYYVENGKINFK